MARRLLATCLVAAALAACTPPRAPTQAPGMRSTAMPMATEAPALTATPEPTPAADATPAPLPSGTQTGAVVVTPTPPPASAAPAGTRSLADRPDEDAGFQLHAVYVVAQDGEDRHLDTDGTIVRSLAAANAWLDRQADGHHLRVDTFGGQPDISFRRDARPAAALQADPQVVEHLGDAAPALGDAAPNKVYVYFFDVDSALKEKVSGGELETLGKGGGGRAVIFLKACPTCELTKDATQPGPYEYTLVHEVLHALNFVAACAPHVTPDQHTADAPNDLMAAIAQDGELALDPGHDDYYGTGRQDCLDLATSMFLAPLPEHPVAPAGRPLATALGATARALQPGLADVPGDDAREDALMAKLQARRTAAGQPAIARDPALGTAARRIALQAQAGTEEPAAAVLAAAGFAGPFGYAATGFSLGIDALAGADAALGGLHDLKWLADPEVTRVGIGVAAKGTEGIAAITYTTSQLVLERLAIDVGPLDTYTLAFDVRPNPGTRATEARPLVDEEAAVFPTPLRAGEVARLYASVPRHGQHRVRLAVGTVGDETFNVDQVVQVDGELPPERAVSLQR